MPHLLPRISSRMLPRSVALLLALPIVAATAQPPADFTTPMPGFRIADNLFYVGSRDLASYLVTTPQGDILINSGYTTSPPLIEKSMAALGFSMRDVKILLISHAHRDHDAGSAAILRRTHARYAVMDGDVPVVESGGRRDPLYPGDHYPSAHVDRVLHDGDTVTLGGATLVAHKTAGHTPGNTTWTLRTTDRGKPVDVVIVGSWNVVSGIRLTGHTTYPGNVRDFEQGFATLHKLPCDIFLASHGSNFDLLEKVKRLTPNGPNPFVDPAGYQRALAEKEADFHKELARQQAGGDPGKP